MMTTFSAVLGSEYAWVSNGPGMDSPFLILVDAGGSLYHPGGICKEKLG